MPLPPRPSKFARFKELLPSILVVVVLILGIVIAYIQESTDITALRDELHNVQKGLSDQLDSQGKSIQLFSQTAVALRQEMDAQKEHVQDLESHQKIEHSEQALISDNLKTKIETLEQTMAQQASRLAELDHIQAKQLDQETDLKKVNAELATLINHAESTSPATALPLPQASPDEGSQDRDGGRIQVNPATPKKS